MFDVVASVLPVFDQVGDADISGLFVQVAFTGDDIHDCIRRVGVVGEGETAFLEVRLDFVLSAGVDDSSGAHEVDEVEGGEDFVARLVDDGDDCYAEAGKSFEGCHYGGSGRCV